jgi:8-oxo-dGTP diphosphatase
MAKVYSKIMKKYVAGFLFSKNSKKVVLISKLRPEWQIGKLNGVGGKIEKGETFYEAIVREFQEETGVEIKDWELFCCLKNKQWLVNFFRAKADADIKSMEDEQVDWYLVKDIYNLNTIPNLRWLIHMALDNVTAEVMDYSGG